MKLKFTPLIILLLILPLVNSVELDDQQDDSLLAFRDQVTLDSRQIDLSAGKYIDRETGQILTVLESEESRQTTPTGYIIQLKQKPLTLQYQELESKAEKNNESLLKPLYDLSRVILPKRFEPTLFSNAEDKSEIIRNKILEEHSNFKQKAMQTLKKDKIARNAVSQQNIDELVILNEYSKVFNGIALDITDKEAEKLEQLGEVEKVFPNRKVQAALFDSVPLINADDVWKLDKDGNDCSTAASVQDKIIEGNTKTYTLNGKNYEVILDFVDSASAKFTVNNLPTSRLYKGETYVLQDGAIKLIDVEYQDYAGGIHSATFLLVDRVCLTGEGVTIGIIDTGVDYSHADLGGSYVNEGRNYTTITSQPITPYFSITPWKHDGQIGMEDNRMVYYSGNKIYLYSFNNEETLEINTFQGVNDIVRLAYNDNVIAYFASTSNIITSLYYYDLNTGENVKILQDYTDIDVGTLSVINNKIIYSIGYFEGAQFFSGVYVYDISTGEPALVDEDSEFLLMPVVSESKIAYSVPGSVCYDKLSVYDMNTNEKVDITPPDVGPILDFKGDKVLYVDCSLSDFDFRWRSYHLYDINTGESIPLFYDSKENITSKTNILNSRGVYGWINKGAIGDRTIFFSKDVNADTITAYDQDLSRYVEINPYKTSGNIDAEGRKVCFLSNDLHIYCHDYDPSYDYSIIPISFNDKVIGGYDFVNNDNDPMDDNGHGTHVAATAAGNGILKGVAPDANIVAYKVLSSRGWGSWDDTIAAIERSVDPNQDNDFSDHLDVISLSLGGSGDPDDPPSQAIDNAAANGVVAVVAAGNNGPSEQTISSPGTARKAITVGATFARNDTYYYLGGTPDDIVYFSSRGPVIWENGAIIKPDVVAPGVNICAAQWDDAFSYGDINCNNDNEHVAISGTSMATPHVSGAVALIKQKNPDWTPEEIKMALRNTAVDIGEEINTQGYGRIDVLRTIDIQNPLIVELTEININNDEAQIIGSIMGNNLQDYELEYGKGMNPGTWTQFAQGNMEITNGVLGTLNIKSISDVGRYIIKTTATDTEGNTFEDRALLKINNDPSFTSIGNVDSFFHYGSPFTVGDINGDGNKEIIAAESNIDSIEDYTNLWVWDKNGNLLIGWPQRIDYLDFIGKKIAPAPGVADIDNDGLNEVIIVSGEFAYAYNADGTFVEGFPINIDPENQIFPHRARFPQFSMGDIDNNGVTKIVSVLTDAPSSLYNISEKTIMGILYIFSPDGQIQTKVLDGIPNSAPSIADINNDGVNEIIVSISERVEVLNNEGNSLPGWPITPTGTQIVNSPLIGDVDNDGQLEIIIIDYSFNIAILNFDGTIKNTLKNSHQKGFNDGADISLVDIDNDNDVEILVRSILETSLLDWDGTILANNEINSTQPSFSIVGDVDNDGKKDIIVWDSDMLQILDENLIVKYERTTNSFSSIASVILTDIDNNQMLDIVGVDEDGNVFAWKNIADYNEESLDWPMFMHDPQHTGNYDFGKTQCTDTDKGINYVVRGNTTGLVVINGTEQFITMVDECSGINGSVLHEHYCGGDFIKTITKDCPTCDNGVCIEEEVPINQTCTDSDGGLDYYKFGQVKAEGNINYAKDECSDTWVIEQFCRQDVSELPSQYHCETNGACYTKLECPNGCKDGACIVAGFEGYPEFLIRNNALDGVLVVGDRATAEDVIAATDIAVSLRSAGVYIGATVLASEVKDPKAQNMILIGRPTEYAKEQANVLIDDFALPALSPGQSLLQLSPNGNNYAVIVTGRDLEGPRNASRYLANWNDYSEVLVGQRIIFGRVIDSCTDTDGKDPYIKGTCSDINGNFTDYCRENAAYEYTCNEENFCSNLYVFECPYGCENGKCLKEKPREVAISVIMTSPDGSCSACGIDNFGNWSCVSVECPT